MVSRVVVVDDEPHNLELVSRVLERAGIVAHPVHDPRQAVTAVEQVRPGCVLLDQRLPYLSGIEVLRRLREDWTALALPVVMMTADGSDRVMDEAFRAGASDFVRKPFGVLELQHRVAAHLRNSDLRGQLANLAASRAAHASRLERVLDAVDMHLWVVDETGAVVTENARAASEDGRDLWGHLVDEGADADGVGPLLHGRVRRATADGVTCHHVIRQEVVVDGRPAVVVAAYDDTDRERARVSLELQLRREQEALAALREAEDMRGRFLAATSHELRTPLTVIQGAVEVAARRVDDDRLRGLLQAADRHAHHLGDLVADVLTVAAGSAGVARLAPVRLDDAVAVAASRLSAAHAPEVDVDDVAVTGDVELLQRVFRAVLDNADRHGAPPARVTARRRAGIVTCRVEDAGPGLDPAWYERVFEPFVQGEVASAHRPGTGIGLTVSRLLVQAHGGEIHLGRSTALGGLAVEIRLPQAVTIGDVRTGVGLAASRA